MGELIRDRYEPIAVAGRGGQGEVLKARDRVHDRLVALKIRELRGDREQLLSEARILLGLKPHPGVPLVREDFFTDDDRYVVVMDWIEGEDLGVALREGAVPFERVCTVLGDIARALDHLHSHEPPIVHKDVKPENIIVTADGRSFLVDFGIAQERGVAYGAGTHAYLAPEVARGAHVDPTADVYGLAATAFALLTGTAPGGSAPAWDHVPEAHRTRVIEAIEHGLAVTPQKRPQSATSFLHRLAPPSTPTNLPAALSSFIGRENELSRLRADLRDARLMTLTGVGGAGKTRLARQLASQALPTFPEGVWWTELASLHEPELILQQVLRALDIAPDAEKDPMDALIDMLCVGHQLLVVDNCEHVVDGVAHLVEQLLTRCPGLTILATSREPLRAAGEIVRRVSPLTVPVPNTDHATLEQAESVRLFVERARSVDRGFSLTEDSARSVADICRGLDGIPLAIELAAARTQTMPVGDIAGAITDHVDVLTGGRRTVPRHETMHAALEWSHDLLSEDERTLLRRLSVFAGGFLPEAAGTVCELDGSLDALVARSLVVSERTRFRLLEPVREYATAQLCASGEEVEVRTRHARWCLELAKKIDSRGDPEGLDRLHAEHDNMRAALSWGLEHDPASALELATALRDFWEVRGHLREGRDWAARALDAAPDAPSGLRVSGQAVTGTLLGRMGLHDEAIPHFETIVDIGEATGDKRAIAVGLGNLGSTYLSLGDAAQATQYFDEALRLFESLDDQLGVVSALHNLGITAYQMGDRPTARRSFERAKEMGRDVLPAIVGDASNNLGAVVRDEGDFTEAESLYGEAIGEARRFRNPRIAARAMEGLSDIAIQHGDHRRAVMLIGAAAGLMLDVGAQVTLPGERESYEEGSIKLRESLGPEAFEEAFTEGRRMDFDAATAFALGENTNALR